MTCISPWSDPTSEPHDKIHERRASPTQSESTTESENFINLPSFLRPLPSQLDCHDHGYLLATGALTIPNTILQNALLKGYMDFVHPFLPIIDFSWFLQTVVSAAP